MLRLLRGLSAPPPPRPPLLHPTLTTAPLPLLTLLRPFTVTLHHPSVPSPSPPPAVVHPPLALLHGELARTRRTVKSSAELLYEKIKDEETAKEEEEGGEEATSTRTSHPHPRSSHPSPPPFRLSGSDRS